MASGLPQQCFFCREWWLMETECAGFTWFWRTLATEYGFTVKDDIFKAQQDAQTAAAAQQQAAPSASQNIAQQAQDVRAKMLGCMCSYAKAIHPLTRVD